MTESTSTHPTKDTGFSIDKILSLLPHRYPFLLVDRVIELTPGKNIRALKNVSINEPFFQGHFPTDPVMPGVLLIEALAQAAALLHFESTPAPADGSQRIVYLAGIDGARFKRPVRPGDQLVLEVDVERVMRGIGKFKCRATVDGQLAAEASIMAALNA